MKNIKSLGITTKEGFEVKDLQHFPSMEWGEDGGMTAKIFYLGAHVMDIIQEGNGGCACGYPTKIFKANADEIKLQALKFLQRKDKNYGPDSEYDWLKKKTFTKIDDDDFEALVNLIEERYDDVKAAKKAFKQGYKAIVTLKNDFQTAYLYYQVDDITDNEVVDFLTRKDLLKENPEHEIIRCTDNLKVF